MTPSFSRLACLFSRLGALALAAALVLSLLLAPQSGALAADASVPALVWQSGSIKVYALQDRPGETNINLFSGPASPEQRAGYFTDGKAPSSFNAFLMQVGDKNTLVDTGYGDSGPGSRGLDAQLAALGLAPDDIDNVALTHMHMDHVAGLLADGKRAFPKAKVHVAKPELDYWLGLARQDPGDANAALVQNIVSAYGTDFQPPFLLGAPIFYGITAIDASGHTPGHTVFHLRGGSRSLLIIGDLLHAAALQFPLPEECAVYDMDAARAVAARKTVLDLAAEKNIPVVGMHIPFPGAGTVAKEGTGYRFTPITTIAE